MAKKVYDLPDIPISLPLQTTVSVSARTAATVIADILAAKSGAESWVDFPVTIPIDFVLRGLRVTINERDQPVVTIDQIREVVQKELQGERFTLRRKVVERDKNGQILAVVDEAAL
jgi:hypothetical protein